MRKHIHASRQERLRLLLRLRLVIKGTGVGYAHIHLRIRCLRTGHIGFKAGLDDLDINATNGSNLMCLRKACRNIARKICRFALADL